jgi:hypothetical protein
MRAIKKELTPCPCLLLDCVIPSDWLDLVDPEVEQLLNRAEQVWAAALAEYAKVHALRLESRERLERWRIIGSALMPPGLTLVEYFGRFRDSTKIVTGGTTNSR